MTEENADIIENLEEILKEDLANLVWSIEAGADEVISDTPCDYFSLSERRVSFSAEALLSQTLPSSSQLSNKDSDKHLTKQLLGSSANIPLTRDSVFTPAPTDEGIKTAREAVKDVKTLEELKTAITSFTACNLKNTAMNTVFADGNKDSKLMLIGEAPGADEDRIGLPFVGQSGQLLDKMLASIGRPRETGFYISNIIPWRPPGNRTPTGAEISLCLPFIEKHIELISPDFLLLLGGTAVSAILDTKESVSFLRGKWHNYTIKTTGKTIPTLVTFHPAYLLRSPLQKRAAWKDLLTLQERINKND